MTEYGTRTLRAPEIYGDFWFNSEPLPLGALRGQIVLVDFWDYSSINCLRTIPYVKEWFHRYRNHGFVVIGVHSPQFPFGQQTANVQSAIERYGIRYPVVMDNQQLIWGLFRNRYLPTKYLIDKDGFIRHVFVGEGSYITLEHSIQSLLIEAGCFETLPIPMEPLRDTDRPDALCYRATPELQTGYVHGCLGNAEAYAPESTVAYTDPHQYLEGRFYLEGQWRCSRTAVELHGESGYIIFPYTAAEVHCVIQPAGTENSVEVFQDELPLDELNRGTDVIAGPDLSSSLKIDEPRSYCIVKNKEFGPHHLRLETTSPGLTIHSISFISAVIPELIQDN